MLFEVNLTASHLGNFFEEVEEGIPVPPFDLVLLILRLRHAIHVVYGDIGFQPLTAEELSLIDKIMSGKFSFPSTKEALALGQRKAEKKWK